MRRSVAMPFSRIPNVILRRNDLPRHHRVYRKFSKKLLELTMSKVWLQPTVAKLRKARYI